MSFDKDYPHRKDRRKPYRDSRAFDHTCRNHGSCAWCLRNRTFKLKKLRKEAEDDERESAESSSREGQTGDT